MKHAVQGHLGSKQDQETLKPNFRSDAGGTTNRQRCGKGRQDRGGKAEEVRQRRQRNLITLRRRDEDHLEEPADEKQAEAWVYRPPWKRKGLRV